MNNLTDDTCALCHLDGLVTLQSPAGTRRNSVVKICPGCALIQSIPHDSHGDGVPRLSSLADFGNLRTGKGDGAGRAATFLSGFLPTPRRVLDVGPGRGEWLRQAMAYWPATELAAIEPDSRLPVIDGVTWLNRRIEEASLPDKSYDLIVLRHTLEHLPDPVATLRQLWLALADTGYLYLEVPNTLAHLKLPDVVEELFIDKHSYHYTRSTLAATLGMGFFKPAGWLSDGDPLAVVAVKGGQRIPGYSNEVGVIQIAITAYQTRRWLNLIRLTGIVEDINRRSHIERVAVFGAGRLLDAMRRVGLELDRLAGIVDSYYPLDEFRHVPVSRPAALRAMRPDVVLCLSREGRGMVEAVNEMEMGCKVVTWRELWR